MKLNYLFICLMLCFTQANSQNFKFGKVSKKEISEEHHPLTPDANAAVLYREHKVRYDYDEVMGMVKITEIFERIKIYNREGFDWATKNILSYRYENDEEDVQEIKGYTYNLVNGDIERIKLERREIYKEEESKHRTAYKFTMPAVKDGSVIEWRYVIKSPFLTDIDKVPLQFTIPINKISVKLSIPEVLSFKTHFNFNSPIVPTLKETKSTTVVKYSGNLRRENLSYMGTRSGFYNGRGMMENKVYIIEEDNIPTLKKELYVDHLLNYAAFLSLELQYTKYSNATMKMYAQTWDDATKSIFTDRGLEQEINRNGFFDNEIDQLLAGISNRSTKVSLIYNYVKQKVKWNGNLGFVTEYGVKDAYKHGVGNVADINLLLIGMLKYAGLNAHPVLVSTPSHGIPIFPTQKGFNYVLASLELPGEILLLDATDQYNALGELPERARNWQGRIIRENGSSSWVNLVPKKSEKQINLNIKFDEQLKVQGKEITIYNGLFAKSYRDDQSNINSEDYIKELERVKGNIIISNLQTKNAETIGENVIESYNFELADAVDNIDGSIYISPFFHSALRENPFVAEERSYPVFMDFPSIDRKVVNMMIPNGYEVSALPQDLMISLNNGQAEFKYFIKQNGSFLRIEAILDLSKIVYAANEYENLKKFYSDVVAKQTEMIVLTKKGLDEY